MGKYQEDARLLLEYVGGKENIAAVSHCVSRMRFVLNDPAKADVAKIEALKSAKGTFTQAGQFQVIIGNTVSDFYNDFIAVSGIDGVSKDAVKSAAKQNQNALQKVMSVLAEIFAPLIPAIITGGLILGFRNCIDSIYFFNNGTQTLCDISQFWSGVDSFLWLIGEAIFHMLPVCICWSVTKKMGTTQSLGIVLGLTLVSGQLLNAYAVASTAAADIPKWDFGFFTVNMIGYQAQVIPAILAAFTLVYLERFFRKICPPVISMIVVPFCSLVLSVIIAHTVLGPIGWKIGTFISDIVYAGISGSFRVVFGAIFGFVYAPLVITGLHHMSNAIDMQLIAEFWRHHAVAHDRPFQHCTGLRCAGHDLPAAQERCRTGSQRSLLHLLLSGRYRACHVRCQPEIPLPIYLRHDWICHRSGRLCGNFHHGQRHRCRRHPWYFVNPARLYAQLCAVHGHCHRRPLCADRHRRQEKRALPDFVRCVP